MFCIYQLTSWIYLLLPVMAVLVVIRYRKRAPAAGLGKSLAGIFLAGGLLGMALSQAWSWLLRQPVPISQIATAMYWMTGLLCGLAGVQLGLLVITGKLLRLFPAHDTSRLRRMFFVVLAGLIGIGRSAVMMGIGIGLMSGMLLSFRPKVVHSGTPMSLIESNYESVTFRATDGVKLRGWWIASPNEELGGRETILVCHGLGGDKATMMPITAELLKKGFNVLVFDFRAHGESGGQMTSFGDVERKDVLGAVRWLERTHREQSARIMGVGVNMGAAALVAAAGDPGEEGQSIAAVAAIDPFDDPSDWIATLAENHLGPGSGVFVSRFALPIAGAQCGVNLARWKPTNDIQLLWPRPVLIIASDRDALVPLRRGQELFESAQQPKYHYWIADQSLRRMIGPNQPTPEVLSLFFREARPIL